MKYRVKEVAALGGVTVRTLHHYDEIGLLKPESSSPAGYRLYSDQNLLALQQILFFKEIGFDLLEIKNIMDNPHFDRERALESHRELLIAKKRRLQEMINTVNKTLNEMKGGAQMEKEELFEGFDMTPIEEHKKKYAAEARQKYGDSMMNAVNKRTDKYTKEDWAEIMEQNGRINAKIIARMDQGPANPQVQEAVGEIRQHITKYYYDCTLEIFRGLGSLYVDDPRFTANIDKQQAGLALFLKEAFHIYCDRMNHN